MLKENVIKALENVMDPELRESVITLKIVFDVEVDEKVGSVSCVFRPTVSTCPIGVHLAGEVKKAISSVDGVKIISIEVRDFFMVKEAEEYIDSI